MEGKRDGDNGGEEVWGRRSREERVGERFLGKKLNFQ